LTDSFCACPYALALSLLVIITSVGVAGAACPPVALPGVPGVAVDVPVVPGLFFYAATVDLMAFSIKLFA
jgi:hypothetical protein